MAISHLSGRKGTRDRRKAWCQGIPVTVFLGKDGRIAKRHIGIIDYSQLSTNIDTILK
jgi:hypothetical protein